MVMIRNTRPFEDLSRACNEVLQKSNDGMKMPVALKSFEEFESFKNEFSKALVVLFVGASWCNVCRSVEKGFQDMSTRHGSRSVIFSTLKFDEGIARRMNVDSVPHFMFFKGGERLDEVIGGDLETLESKMDALLVKENVRTSTKSVDESILHTLTTLEARLKSSSTHGVGVRRREKKDELVKNTARMILFAIENDTRIMDMSRSLTRNKPFLSTKRNLIDNFVSSESKRMKGLFLRTSEMPETRRWVNRMNNADDVSRFISLTGVHLTKKTAKTMTTTDNPFLFSFHLLVNHTFAHPNLLRQILIDNGLLCVSTHCETRSLPLACWVVTSSDEKDGVRAVPVSVSGMAMPMYKSITTNDNGGFRLGIKKNEESEMDEFDEETSAIMDEITLIEPGEKVPVTPLRKKKTKAFTQEFPIFNPSHPKSSWPCIEDRTGKGCGRFQFVTLDRPLDVETARDVVFNAKVHSDVLCWKGGCTVNDFFDHHVAENVAAMDVRLIGEGVFAKKRKNDARFVAWVCCSLDETPHLCKMRLPLSKHLIDHVLSAPGADDDETMNHFVQLFTSVVFFLSLAHRSCNNTIRLTREKARKSVQFYLCAKDRVSVVYGKRDTMMLWLPSSSVVTKKDNDDHYNSDETLVFIVEEFWKALEHVAKRDRDFRDRNLNLIDFLDTEKNSRKVIADMTCLHKGNHSVVCRRFTEAFLEHRFCDSA